MVQQHSILKHLENSHNHLIPTEDTVPLSLVTLAQSSDTLRSQ